MNLDRIPSSSPSPALQSVGNRLDVTLKDPATPVQASRISASQVGSIEGVLTPEENRAIAALFDSAQNVYTADGATRQLHPECGSTFEHKKGRRSAICSLFVLTRSILRDFRGEIAIPSRKG